MSEAVKEKKGGNTLKIIIIVLLIAILLGLATFGGYYVASRNTPKETPTATEEKVEEVTYFETGEYVINLADTESRRYFKATIVLQYDGKNKKLAEEIQLNLPAIRDSIISVIGEKKAEQLSAKGKEDLKKEILTRVNPLFEKGKVLNVFYNDVLVQ